ncbi:MAG: beta-propeller domain-containing protein [Oscillospiraceae bacterium]|nr:beta-propeller domain-containing protein [Oscillospiraceae bacterium]
MIETLNAAGFLSEIKRLKLSGKDFLEIIGNSKISNDIYNEIKENAGLTYERLVGLLESSALTSEDFARLLRDAHTLAQLRVLERRKGSEQRLGQALGQAEERLEQQAKVPVKTPVKTPEKTQNIGFEPELKIADDDGLYEDIIDDEPEENDGEAYITAADNRGKIIFCFCLVLLLTCASFGLRWFYTGSLWLPKEEIFVFEAPETYHELAERLMNAGDSPSVRIGHTQYAISGEDSDLSARTLLFNNKYIFNVIKNSLYIVEYNNGIMQKIAEIEYNNEQIRELYLLGDKLYVITESEYEGSFHHVGNAVLSVPHEPEETLEPEIIADNFTQKTVSVRVYDSWDFGVQPELTLTADGEYNAVLLHKNRLILATDYTPHEPQAYSDLSAFVPSAALNGDRKFIDMSNIYAPPAALMNTEMTVLVMLDGAEAVGEFAVVGGAASVYAGEDALFIAQSAGEKSRLIRFDLNSEDEPVFFDTDGVIPVGGVSERHSILRVGVFKDDKAELYIFNNELELLSGVQNIGNEPLDGVLFDNSHVYFIGEKLYAFDTANLSEVVPVEDVTVQIHADYFHRISDRERLEVVVELDESDNRAGIRLNVHARESIIATYLITADSNVAGNWNPFLFTDAEFDKEAVFIAERTGIILVPIKFSNGIADIEKLLVFDFHETTGFTLKNEIVYIYELGGGNERRRALLIDGFIYSFWDTTAVSADELDGSVVMKLEL